MKFGFFDDNNREYVITNPKTPYPWINYLGNEDFFSLISNTAGGYSFYKDAKLRRISRYRYNNVPTDDGGRYFYINDDNNIWSPGWKPIRKKLDSYECRHGLGYTKIKSKLNNLQAEALFFVPNGFDGEVQKLSLKNDSNETKKIKVHSFVEWALWDAQDDMTNFQRNFNTGEVEVENSTIYHKTEYRERRNHFAFYSVNREIDGFDTDRETFLGLYNGFDCPDQVIEGKSANSICSGWSPIASHFFEIELKPNEQQDLIFIVGYTENEQDKKFSSKNIINKEKALKMISQFKTTEQVDKSMHELEQFWTDLLGKFQIKSSDDKLDRMLNIWNQYQCMITYFFSRSASYFESGIGRGMGFRDSNQDIIGMTHMRPDLARKRILDLAATQMKDGSAFHQYQPLTKKGNHEIGGNFMDDPLWLIFAVSSYIKETGDMSILDVQTPFDSGEETASLFEHIKLSFYHVVNNLGPHGLPLIGRADWNDCLNLNCFSSEPGEAFQTVDFNSNSIAESVMIAAMFVKYGKEFAELCELTDKHQEFNNAQVHIKSMQKSIELHAWDGDWFLRAYDYYGDKVGSNENEEAKIFIEPQGFTVMAGIGIDDGKAQKAMNAVEERLATPYGIVLVNPAYTEYKLNIGEISSYPPGYKENAGIFCHSNPWIIIAETILGNNEKAFDYYKRISPAYLEEISEIHRTEPYVYSQMIAGKDAVNHGEAKNSWLTGTAAWNFYALSHYILGIKPDYEGLRIEPHLPSNIKNLNIVRVFRGDKYIIHIQNNGGKKVKCICDGVEINGLLPYSGNGKTFNVEVII